MALMTSLQRVLTSLGFQEPDRVPFFLLFTMHGAKELGMSIKEYFSRSENVVEGQLRLRAKFRHDCLNPFFYAAAETEAWGGDVIYIDNGPPNAGEPVIKSPEQINSLKVPEIGKSPSLLKMLDTIKALKDRAGDEAPVIGTAISPFSLPVIQMEFEGYLQLMLEQQDYFWKLMNLNQEFCVAWANAQLEAGAIAVAYFDPVSSSTIITREQYLKMGFPIAKETITRIKGPTATHFASGRCLPIIDDVIKTGTAAIGVSAEEDLAEIKFKCYGKVSVLGNLNGITMRHWTATEAENEVKQAIARAGKGGGFLLADNHGEIPYQVPDEVLFTISEAVHKWGKYPLSWVKND